MDVHVMITLYWFVVALTWYESGKYEFRIYYRLILFECAVDREVDEWDEESACAGRECQIETCRVQNKEKVWLYLTIKIV